MDKRHKILWIDKQNYMSFWRTFPLNGDNKSSDVDSINFLWNLDFCQSFAWNYIANIKVLTIQHPTKMTLKQQEYFHDFFVLKIWIFNILSYHIKKNDVKFTKVRTTCYFGSTSRIKSIIILSNLVLLWPFFLFLASQNRFLWYLNLYLSTDKPVPWNAQLIPILCVADRHSLSRI